MVAPMFPVPQDAASAGATDVKWFAGLAMQAMIAQHGIPESEAVREEIALWAYRMAQTMIKTDKQLHASEDDS